MALLENEDFDLIIGRTLYLTLRNLKSMGLTREEDNVVDDGGWDLGDALYEICILFGEPDGTENITEYGPNSEANIVTSKKWFRTEDSTRLEVTEMEYNQEWTQSGALDKYLDKYKSYLNFWSEVRLDNYSELFDNKFALIRNGKFKHHLIAGKKNSDEDMSLKIWTDKICGEEKQYEFNFGSREEIENFLGENKIVIDSLLSNDFFLDEKVYITAFKEQFSSRDFFDLRNFSPFKNAKIIRK
jgi:hypothetical protein